MILNVGCWAGCRFVAGFVAGKSTSLLPGNTDIKRLCCHYLYLLATKATKNSKKTEKVKITSQTLDCRFYGVRCRISLPYPFVRLSLWR